MQLRMVSRPMQPDVSEMQNKSHLHSYINIHHHDLQYDYLIINTTYYTVIADVQSGIEFVITEVTLHL